MTDQDEIVREALTQLCRELLAKASDQFRAKGVSGEDVAIAAAYGALDQAKALMGGNVAAIEWLRGSLDVMEAQLMGIASVGH